MTTSCRKNILTAVAFDDWCVSILKHRENIGNIWGISCTENILAASAGEVFCVPPPQNIGKMREYLGNIL